MATFGRARSLAALSLLSLSSGMFSCGPRGGTDVGNGFDVKLNLKAYEAPTTTPAGVTLADGVVVDALFMTASRFRLQPGTDCSTIDTGVDVEGPLVADLAGKGFLGGEPVFAVETDKFCRLRLQFDELDASALPDGAPPELAGLSILLEGHRADGTPFVVRSRMTGELRLGASAGAFPLPTKDQGLIVGVEIARAIDELDLDTLSGNPIEIDDTSNVDRLQAFEEAVKTATSLFRDENDDGDLSPGESESSKEIGHAEPE